MRALAVLGLAIVGCAVVLALVSVAAEWLASVLVGVRPRL